MFSNLTNIGHITGTCKEEYAYNWCLDTLTLSFIHVQNLYSYWKENWLKKKKLNLRNL